jgi:hypothetical protein
MSFPDAALELILSASEDEAREILPILEFRVDPLTVIAPGAVTVIPLLKSPSVAVTSDEVSATADVLESRATVPPFNSSFETERV